MVKETKDKARDILTVKDNVTNNTVESDKPSETNDRNDNEIHPSINAETAIIPPIDKTVNNSTDGRKENEAATAQGDRPIF